MAGIMEDPRMRAALLGGGLSMLASSLTKQPNHSIGIDLAHGLRSASSGALTADGLLRAQEMLDERKKMNDIINRSREQEMERQESESAAVAELMMRDPVFQKYAGTGAFGQQLYRDEMQARREDAQFQQRAALERDLRGRQLAADNRETWKVDPEAGVRVSSSGVVEPLVTIGHEGERIPWTPPASSKMGEFNDENALADDFRTESRDHDIISRGVSNVLSGIESDSALGQQAAIYAFMKILDPTSTVREGEAASVENARGIPESMRNAYNKAREGTKLTDKQQGDIVNVSSRLYQDSYPKQKERLERYTKRAKDRNINPSSVVRDYDTEMQKRISSLREKYAQKATGYSPTSGENVPPVKQRIKYNLDTGKFERGE